MQYHVTWEICIGTDSKRVKLICPHCSSGEIVRDACAVWSEPEQKWEIADLYDVMSCNECGKEFKEAYEVESHEEAEKPFASS